MHKKNIRSAAAYRDRKNRIKPRSAQKTSVQADIDRMVKRIVQKYGTVCGHSRGPRKAPASDHGGDPMKNIRIEGAKLEDCVRQAQRERVVLTRDGKPVAVLVGVKGLDWEQLELGHSDEFWSLIRARRGRRTISRDELEKRLAKP